MNGSCGIAILTMIPAPIPLFGNITHDYITAIVEIIGNNLKTAQFSCTNCSDAVLQSIVNHCPNLEELFLENAGISKIPHNIGLRLPKLQRLYLGHNRIKTLPPSLVLLYIENGPENEIETTHFFITGNPLEDPPIHIAMEGIKAISKYFFKQYVDTFQSGTKTDNSNSGSVDDAPPSAPPDPISRQQSSSQQVRKRKYIVEVDDDECDPEGFDGINVLHACGDDENILVTNRTDTEVFKL